jgi:hypothetical protein
MRNVHLATTVILTTVLAATAASAQDGQQRRRGGGESATASDAGGSGGGVSGQRQRQGSGSTTTRPKQDGAANPSRPPLSVSAPPSPSRPVASVPAPPRAPVTTPPPVASWTRPGHVFTPVIDHYQRLQELKIERNHRTGNLTRQEYEQLKAEQARIAELERRAKADGNVTREERLAIRSALQNADRNIYAESTDRDRQTGTGERRRRGGWFSRWF